MIALYGDGALTLNGHYSVDLKQNGDFLVLNLREVGDTLVALTHYANSIIFVLTQDEDGNILVFSCTLDQNAE